MSDITLEYFFSKVLRRILLFSIEFSNDIDDDIDGEMIKMMMIAILFHSHYPHLLFLICLPYLLTFGFLPLLFFYYLVFYL